MKITVGKTSKKNLKRLYGCYGILLVLLIPFLLLAVYLDDVIYKVLLALFLLMMILVFVLIVPGLSYLGKIWQVDEVYFRHIVFNSYLEKCRMFYDRSYIPYHVTLKLKNIDYMTVSYYCRLNYPYRFLYSEAGYPVVIRFYMQDGSEFLFEKMLSDDREKTIAAFNLMKKQGVRIIDEDHILMAYQKGMNLQQYLMNMEKEKSHD